MDFKYGDWAYVDDVPVCIFDDDFLYGEKYGKFYRVVAYGKKGSYCGGSRHYNHFYSWVSEKSLIKIEG